MIQALMEELDLSIAFPTQAGAMDVINVPMQGVREMLSRVMPNLPGADTPSERPGSARQTDVPSPLTPPSAQSGPSGKTPKAWTI